jgi:NAD(P)-dependent dehydrogenase (short-subunit alcohol dehydrogenase family)
MKAGSRLRSALGTAVPLSAPFLNAPVREIVNAILMPGRCPAGLEARMELRDKVVVVTGGASGIGAAMARRFAAEGAAAVVLADRDHAGAAAVADEVGRAGAAGVAARTDVAAEPEVRALVEGVLERFGRIDLLCSNAGVAAGRGLDAPAEDWERAWRVNVLAHVYAARAALPAMLERGEGYLLQTCSAAGLLTNPGDAPYTLSKHAAVAFAEWLSVTYGGAGIRVSALCPQGVRTPMLLGGLDAASPAAMAVAAAGELLEPDEVARVVVEGLAAERFLILPHPQVATYLRNKATDPDRWLAGVRRLAAGAGAAAGATAERRPAGATAERRPAGDRTAAAEEAGR